MADINLTPIQTFSSGDIVLPADLNQLAQSTVALTAGTIVAADIASDAVTTAKILDANVTTAKLAATLDLSSKTVALPSLAQTITAQKFSPTTATATGDGMYLAGTNTLGFSTNGTGQVFINSAGNTSIGTSSDFGGYKLSVLGNSGSGVVRIGTTGGAVIYALFNFNGSVDTGSITTDTVNTSYNITSDYRLKENFRPISNALQRLLQLNPLKFKWKSANIESEGFVAHELAEVVPQAVTGAKDAINADTNEPEYQQVDASKVIPLLVAAVQELSAKVAALEAKQA